METRLKKDDHDERRNRFSPKDGKIVYINDAGNFSNFDNKTNPFIPAGINKRMHVQNGYI